LTATQVDSVQEVIIKKYKEGVPFKELARNYSMDGNAENGGDLGWFSKKMMVKEFSEPVSSHDHNDIFTVDIPSKQWYYVVLKTYPDRQRIKKGIIKIKSSS
jgi:parvulin-like peptidyl-prolyl isomerase